jgi:hypothetical protein
MQGVPFRVPRSAPPRGLVVDYGEIGSTTHLRTTTFKESRNQHTSAGQLFRGYSAIALASWTMAKR